MQPRFRYLWLYLHGLHCLSLALFALPDLFHTQCIGSKPELATMGFGKVMKTKIQTVLFGVSKLYFVLFIPPVVAQAAADRSSGTLVR